MKFLFCGRQNKFAICTRCKAITAAGGTLAQLVEQRTENPCPWFDSWRYHVNSDLTNGQVAIFMTEFWKPLLSKGIKKGQQCWPFHVKN